MTLLRSTLGEGISCTPPVSAEPALGSRAKMKLAVGGTASSPVLGFVNQRGEVRELLTCPLHVPELNDLAHSAWELLPQSGLTPYDVPARSGELKYLLAQRAASSGEIMLRLVLRSTAQRSAAEGLVKKLIERHPNIVVSSLNIQPEHKAVIEGDEEVLLTSRQSIIDRIGSYEFEFFPKSFSQVTPHVAEKLYHRAAELLRDRSATKLLDLYCGVGAFSIFASAFIKEGCGVELSEAAVAAARLNCARNKITNLCFHAGDAAEYLTHNSERFDAILVNPPRSGLRGAVTQALLEHHAETLLYSSCNPETLARDLRLLSTRYRIEAIMPFDMFPMTEHIEALVALSIN